MLDLRFQVHYLAIEGFCFDFCWDLPVRLNPKTLKLELLVNGSVEVACYSILSRFFQV